MLRLRVPSSPWVMLLFVLAAFAILIIPLMAAAERLGYAYVAYFEAAM